MPAIVDPSGPDNKAISIFESRSILQYLSAKEGKFCPNELRKRIEVEQWLFRQMANLGPMASQAAHFRNYKLDKIVYAIERYSNEVIRLYRVVNARLQNREFLVDEISIADMACWPWIRGYKAYDIDLKELEHLLSWFKRIVNRPAVRDAAYIGKRTIQKFTKPRTTPYLNTFLFKKYVLIIEARNNYSTNVK